ncbi:hypothetical protein BDW59DRAFT_14748 [Aspergillus cavernicola]|uniref:Uncharacterized protein n=1 Tax=Aspergillus cavernicola TaxID=176166 RepID=A0ABR4ITH6_9EURO
MPSLSEIRGEIFNSNEAKRIIIRGRTKSLDSEACHATAYRVMNEVFPDWEQDSRILFLGTEVWGKHIYMAIDINHHDYNYSTAHKDETVLPVFILRPYRKSWVLIRWPQGDEFLVMSLAELHRVNGYEVATPFLENHNTHIVHANPREFHV